MSRRLAFVLFLLAAGPASAAEAPVSTVEGQLARGEVSQVLEKGPQRFIASIRVAPHLVKGRFAGFRLVQVLPDSPLATSTSVLPGDVVVSVNEQSLERPEQFMRAWDVVKGADRLSVVVLREGRRLSYSWKIIP